MSVPGFVAKSQFHACRLMFAFKNMTYLDDVKTWKFFVTFGNLSKTNQLTHVGFHSLSLALSPELCVSVCVPL